MTDLLPNIPPALVASVIPTVRDTVREISTLCDLLLVIAKKTSSHQESKIDLGTSDKKSSFESGAERFGAALRKASPENYPSIIEKFEELYSGLRLTIIYDETNPFAWLEEDGVCVSISEKTVLYISSIYCNALKYDETLSATQKKFAPRIKMCLAKIFSGIIQRKDGLYDDDIKILKKIIEDNNNSPNFSQMIQSGPMAEMVKTMQQSVQKPGADPSQVPPLTAETIQQMMGSMANNPQLGKFLENTMGMLTQKDPAQLIQSLGQMGIGSLFGQPPAPDGIPQPPPTPEQANENRES